MGPNDISKPEQSPLSLQTESCFRVALACGSFLLWGAAALLLAWAVVEGIVIPPKKGADHPISILGLPAAIFCGLMGWIGILAQQQLRLGRPRAAFGYVILVPLAAAGFLAFLLFLDWLGI